MHVLEHLEPKSVFRYFEELSAIPRGTFDTKRVSDYCVRFAKERGLPVIQDEANNVVIRKNGTPGYENSEPVILQGHLDMVCEKTEDSSHDFTKDGLDLYAEDGFVKAKDTTLGGDDGIAVAMALAVLDSSDIPHPPIEALFTTDEESGMGGAIAADLSLLKGKKLINIDSEEEGYLTVGCAGGIDAHTYFSLHGSQAEGRLVRVRISGLAGGHSGSEIHLQRGNALKLMGQLLHCANQDRTLRLVSLDGGSKRNVIAMDCTAVFFVKDDNSCAFIGETAARLKEQWDAQFMGDEPGLSVTVSDEGRTSLPAASPETTGRITDYLFLMPNGPQAYSRRLAGQVDTSLNPGVVSTKDDVVGIHALIRSASDSSKTEVAERLRTLAALCGASFETDGAYPGWMYREESPLREVMVEAFREMYGHDPEVITIHAGLECGLFLGKRPDLDCVSFGPDIPDVHSVRERLSIASVERCYDYLKAVLAKCR